VVFTELKAIQLPHNGGIPLVQHLFLQTFHQDFWVIMITLSIY